MVDRRAQRILIGVLACLVIGVAGAAPAHASDWPNPRFERLLPEDGLSSAATYALIQDRTGFLWIGTESGLNRFDGYTFETFRHDPDRVTSLASDDISFLLQDAPGALWIATWGGGLDRFDPILSTFEHHRADPSRSDRLQDDRIQHLFEDPEGVLWIGTFAGGLSRLTRNEDGTSTTLTTYRHDPDDPASLCHDRVWATLEDPSSGALWVATSQGLCLFDRASETFERFSHQPEDANSLSDDVVRALYVDSDRVLWVGTRSGLNRFDRLSKTFQSYFANPEGLSHNIITAIFEDHQGTLWVGTRGGGLNAFDRTTDTWHQYRHSSQDPLSLSDDDVRAILEDRSGVLWIATRRGGLNKLDLKPVKFDTVTRAPDSQTSVSGAERVAAARGPQVGLRNERVRALAEDAEGRLWLATADGIERLDPKTERLERLRHNPRDSRSLPANDTHRLLVDRAGTLWLGAGGGLHRYDPRRSIFSTLALQHDRDGSTSGQQVTSLLEDRTGHLWVGSRSGLYQFDPERRLERHFRHAEDDPTSLGEDFVTVLWEDSDRTLWVGTHNHGLHRLDGSSGAFERFDNRPGEPNTLSNNRVSALFQHASGPLWVGTGNGLNQRRTDGTFQRWLENDGLPHPQIAAILGDDSGRLWLATGDGLSRFDPEAGTFRNYTAEDGLQSGSFHPGAALARRDGRLCFGGTRGYSCFDPRQMADSTFAPQVVLTGFDKLGERVRFDRAPWAVDLIRLSPEDDFFTFKFAALDYTRSENNRYRYQLEGYDRDWVEAGSRRSASYRHVPPGDYTFRVAGSNSDRVFSPQTLAVRLSIEPPIWQTAWFRGLALGLLLTVAYSAYSFRVRKHIRREQILAQRVEDSLADLKRSEERYRLLFERNLAGVVRATVDGQILDCNEAFARILGYATPIACRSQHVLDLEAAPEGERSLAERLQEDGTVRSVESFFKARDGSMVAVLWNATRVPGTDGEPDLIEGTAIDVSERRRIEEGLRRAQKMESLGMLAGGIAHDFNNLLMSILGNVDLARQELEPRSPVQDRLASIDSASVRAAELAKQMLAYSGQGEFVVHRVDLSEVVRNKSDLISGAVSKKAWLVYELESDLPLIAADTGQMEQIILSLVRNACEALGSGGGPITLQTGSRDYSLAELAETYLDDQLPAGPYVYLEVVDGGCGMDEDLQLKIFDPFFTTKFTGRGLGLAAVLGIVRGHHGAIKIDSTPERGSRFTLLFPALTPDTETGETLLSSRSSEAPSPEPPASPDRGMVLVVDDEEFVRRVAQDMLSTLGFEVLTAGDGLEGVEIFKRRAADIDLVLLDLSMPRMSGEEAFGEIRRIVPDARVILASGYDEQESTQQFAGRGLSGFIQKPYRLLNLEEKIEQVLDS